MFLFFVLLFIFYSIIEMTCGCLSGGSKKRGGYKYTKKSTRPKNKTKTKRNSKIATQNKRATKNRNAKLKLRHI
jgi:hypothetical protein